MEYYVSIELLIKNYNNLLYPGRIYVEGDKKINFVESQFWVLSSKESKNQNWVETEYGTIPESLLKFGVCSFLDVGTFQDIIETKLEQCPSLSINNIDILIKAIDYYLKNDDFQD